MSRQPILIAALTLGSAMPAFAAGFPSTQFVLLLLVNLALGAVLTLFAGILAGALLEKLRPAKRVKVRVAQRRSR